MTELSSSANVRLQRGAFDLSQVLFLVVQVTEGVMNCTMTLKTLKSSAKTRI